jgi:hypothetical protein
MTVCKNIIYFTFPLNVLIRTTSADSKKKNMSVGVKKKGTKENKLSYIGVAHSSDNVRMKV